jgi:hypothetical protein
LNGFYGRAGGHGLSDFLVNGPDPTFMSPSAK